MSAYADITELDDTANRMRAYYLKAENFMTNFAQDYNKVSELIASGRYGPDWTMTRWFVLKLGMSERQAQRRIKMFKDDLAADEREKIEEKEKGIREARAHEREIQAQAKLEAAKRRLQVAQERDAAAEEIKRLRTAARVRKLRARTKKSVTQTDTVSPHVTLSPAPTPVPKPPTTVTTVRCVCPLCGDAHQAQVKKPKLAVVS